MSSLIIFINYLFDYTFFFEIFSQIIILYTLYFFIKSRNIFYSLLYFFILLVQIGVFISYYQYELFTGFLWVAEFTIILVFLILLIYLNTDGYLRHFSYFNFYKFIYTIPFIIFSLYFYSSSYNYMNSFFIYDYFSLWDDYYEALNNTTVNDFNGLFLSYYYINSFEYLIFAFLLLVGTFLTVSIFKLFFSYKTSHYSSFFNIFNLKLNYNFIRQQNLFKQTSSPAVNRVYKKKN